MLALVLSDLSADAVATLVRDRIAELAAEMALLQDVLGAMLAPSPAVDQPQEEHHA